MGVSWALLDGKGHDGLELSYVGVGLGVALEVSVLVSGDWPSATAH